jgi:hypothetical protein
MGEHLDFQWQRNNPRSPRVQYLAKVPTEKIPEVIQRLQLIGAVDLLALKNYNSKNSRQKTLIKFVRSDVAIENLWQIKNLNPNITRNLAAATSTTEVATDIEKTPIKIEADIRFLGSYLPNKDGKDFSVYHPQIMTLINSWLIDLEAVDYQGAPEILDFRSYAVLFGKRYKISDQDLDISAGIRRLRVGVPDSDFYDIGIRYRLNNFSLVDSIFDGLGWFRDGRAFEAQLNYFPIATNQLIQNITAYSLKMNLDLRLNKNLSLITGIYNHLFKFDAFGEPGKESSAVNNRTFFGEIGISYKF